ncbi:unnamed protein product [Blepharisma stoltei]|uniref:Uncharacterized protein n=1 Tax=Blepharisma stoltei TaxID=1481888 RepID=A0AAU9INX9_9CILI|nr:unnamed protein product [Blepharisma stoltei]
MKQNDIYEYFNNRCQAIDSSELLDLTKLKTDASLVSIKEKFLNKQMIFPQKCDNISLIIKQSLQSVDRNIGASSKKRISISPIKESHTNVSKNSKLTSDTASSSSLSTEKEIKRRRKEFKDLLKKLNQEKEERRILMEKEEAKHQLKISEEIEQIKRSKTEHENLIRLTKQQQLEELHLKSQQRKESMRLQIEILKERTPSHERPRFVIMEEKFRHEFEMPELEKRKLILAKKRFQVQPMNQEDFKEHLKKYKEYIKDAQERRARKLKANSLERSLNSYSSVRSLKRFEDKPDDCAQKEFFERQCKMKKQKKYGEIVREFFAPKLAEKIRSESSLNFRGNQFATPMRIKKHQNIRAATEASSASISPIPSPFTERIKKIKPKLKIKSQQSITPKIKETHNYLSEQRKKREEFSTLKNSFEYEHIDWDSIGLGTGLRQDRAKIIREMAQDLEREVRRQEIISKSISPMSDKSLKIEEYMNDLLLQSVKAKMKLVRNS